MPEFKDKDGNVIDLKGVDENVISVVGLIVEGQMAGVRSAIAEQVSSAVGEAVGKVVEEQIKPLADKVAKAPAAQPKTDDGDKTDLQKAIEAAMAPVLQTVESLKSERESEKAAQTSRQIAESYVAKHRPNLRGKDRLIARIAAAGVKSEDDCKKPAGEWDAEMKDILGDEGFKQLSADAEGEGAKDTPKGSGAEAEKAKADKIKDIRQRGAA